MIGGSSGLLTQVSFFFESFRRLDQLFDLFIHFGHFLLVSSFESILEHSSHEPVNTGKLVSQVLTLVFDQFGKYHVQKGLLSPNRRFFTPVTRLPHQLYLLVEGK